MIIKQQALPLPGAPVRECLECRKVFIPEDSNQELCSQQCAQDWWQSNTMIHDYFKELIR